VVIAGIVVLPEVENTFTFELAPQLSVTLTPATLTPAAGSTLAVAWEGAPAGGGDLELGPDGEDTYLIALPAVGAKSEVDLRLPLVIGALELRFVIEGPDGSKLVIGRAVLDLQEVAASLQAPDEATGGSTIAITWTGPDNLNDFITVVEAGAPEGTWRNYEETATGNPLELTLPDTPGEYELRYLDGYQNGTLASRPITVVEGSASIRAPTSAMAGATVEVEVLAATGNPDDYLTIVAAGAEEGSYLDYEFASEPGTYSLHAPDVAGEYEIRYITGGENVTLARQPLTLTEAVASVRAPAVVGPAEFFDVHWEGPDGDGDYVTIVPASTPEGEWGYSLNTSGGNPLTLESPEEPGEYEVRYVTGWSGLTLATWPLTVR